MDYYSSPRWTAEIADCSMPMTMDTYSNCSYRCIYCFSQYQRGIGEGKDAYLNNEVKWVNTENFKKIWEHPENSQFGEYVKAGKTMQWGGLSDQFDENERKYGKTLEMLRWLRKNYPDQQISFSTKATWWLDDPRYVELFKDNPNWNCKFSIITLEAEKARIVEAGVDSPQKRLDAIEKYAKLNAGGATLRLRPFIIGISTPTYLDLIREAGNRGATALSTEFFCVERRSNVLKERFHYINELCGFDLYKFYEKYSVQQGYMRLNRKIKEPLGVVKNRYRIVQNDEAFDFVDNIVGNDEVECRYETAGSLFNGKKIFLLVKLPEKNLLGDAVENYLFFTNSHDGSSAFMAGVTNVRVVCNNTLQMAIGGAKRTWYCRHTQSIDSKKQQAQEALGLAVKYIDSMDDVAENLYQKKIDEELFFRKLFDAKYIKDQAEKNKETMIERMHIIYTEKDDLQNFKGSAWGMYNAVADYLSNSIPLRQTKTYQENKLDRFFGGDYILQTAQNILMAA